MLRNIGWRLLGSLCFWWSMGLAMFGIYLGVNRIETAIDETAAVSIETAINETAAICREAVIDETAAIRREAAFDGTVEVSLDWKSECSSESDCVCESAASCLAPAEVKYRSKSTDQQVRAENASEAKRVALTFDDGPHPRYTAELLDGLRERGIPATFFLIGENISGNEELVRQMSEDGHLIGNHTYHHADISKLSSSQVCEEVAKTNALIEAVTGAETDFIRPPFGAWEKTIECAVEMLPVLWDVDSLDWTTKNTTEIVERVLKNTEPGDIILMHDAYPSSVDAALQTADILLEQGWQFVTVDQLILE